MPGKLAMALKKSISKVEIIHTIRQKAQGLVMPSPKKMKL